MNWERLPFRLMIVYLLGTVLTFAFGPVDWPVENWRDLLVFVTAIFVALYVGYRLGARGPSRGTELRAWRWVFFVGATATIILLFPSALLYTGKMPWDVLQTAQDQGEAYQDLQYNLSLTTYQDRAAVAIMRTVVSPFAFAALPLGILHWRDLSWLLRLLFGATILSSIIFSSLRGTDREIADLVIIFFTTLLVVIARGMVYRDTSLLAEITRHRLAVFLITIFFATAALVFVERKEQRIVNTHQICVTDNPICVDYDYPLFKLLDDRGRFALSMASMYFSQGYFGLSLALTKDFQTTWGLGHSLALMNYYSAFAGSEDLYERSYTFRLRDEGWSDLNLWSTMFPWLANDIGFPAIPLVIGLLAWIWGSSWKDAVLRNNDRAAIVFIFMMFMIFYMPANSQLTQTIDAYFAVVCWNIVWLVDRFRSHLKQR